MGMHGNGVFIFVWDLGVNFLFTFSLGVEESLSQSAAKHTTITYLWWKSTWPASCKYYVFLVDLK